MQYIRLKLCFTLIAANFFFVVYSQDSKVHQIDSTVNQIRRHSNLLVQITFDSSWLKLPMGPRYQGRKIRKSYYDSNTGELKKVEIDKHTYYYYLNQLIKVEWKPRRQRYIYYDGSEVVKNSMIDKPAEHWEAIQSVRRRASENANSELKLGKLYLESFLRRKK